MTDIPKTSPGYTGNWCSHGWNQHLRTPSLGKAKVSLWSPLFKRQQAAAKQQVSGRTFVCGPRTRAAQIQSGPQR